MAKKSNGWINDVAQILESKDKSKLYLKVNKDISLQKDDVLMMKKQSEFIDGLVESGHLSPEEGEERKKKTTFVKYILSKGPKQ